MNTVTIDWAPVGVALGIAAIMAAAAAVITWRAGRRR